MKKKLHDKIENMIQNVVQKEIDNIIEEKCIFLCYQPTIPTKLKKVRDLNLRRNKFCA